MYLKSYKELIVWQKAVLLAKEVSLLTERFPKSEIYGLISQIMLNFMTSVMKSKLDASH